MTFAVPQTRIETAEIAPDTFVVSAAGLLDDDTALDLRRALLPVAAADGSIAVLDLQSASVVGPATLGVIASAAHMARRRGETMVIVTRDPVLVQSIRDSGLGEIVRLERTIADGVSNGG